MPKIAQKSCETPFRQALQACGVVLLDVPKTGGRFVGKNRFVPQPCPPDLCGTAANGRAFVADAKTTDRERLYVNHAFSNREGQKRQILEAGKKGAIAGLLVESSYRGRWYWASWSQLESVSLEWNVLRCLGVTSKLPDCQFIGELR